MQSDSDIPHIVEGADPFDDQGFADSVLTNEEPLNPEVEEKKKELITRIYRSIKAKAPDATLQEIREIFMYKFGTFLESMNFMGLYEAERWAKTLETKEANNDEIESNDYV